ncbi:ABC transporter permease [Rhizosphaericola mali]|uniref:FtsX-like permease family protein n=1 Tax=Rhizosphaericola mali TaxID=2545455 RepID=A0A5P2G2Z1_9BACT|nr:ABC transporter permease [Rhizosphaericola mali]QES89088.1 FtsX-like permease family protein [Rhizosphaericola mali]
MFKNYLKTAWRNIVKNKFFTLINLLCLSLGITFSLLIGIYIFSQFNVNRNLKNINNQYVLKSKWKQKEMGLAITTLPPLAKILKDEYPELVNNYYRFNPVTNVVSNGNIHFKEDIAIGDTSLVSMYGLPVLYGNAKQAFRDNNSAVITASMATKLYGTTNAINRPLSIRTLKSGESQQYIVTAVLDDIPYNSVLNIIDIKGYSVFVPTAGNRYYPNIVDPSLNWNNTGIGMIEISPNISVKILNDAVKKILKKYTSNYIQINLTVEIVPIKDYYLKDNNGAVNKMILTLSLIALFILLMAVFNFVNINIGTSSSRLREIGMRKVFGSSKKQLVIYSLTESILLTVISGIFSLFFYELLRPYFSQMFSSILPHIWFFHFFEIGYLILLVLFVGIVSGLYPAFWLSNLQTVQSVKGVLQLDNNGNLLRKVLLILQFSLGIFACISAWLISTQINYIFAKDLGYDKEQLMVVSAFPKQWDTAGLQKMESIKKSLLDLPDVKSVSLTFNLPDNTPNNSTIDLMPINGSDKPIVTPFFQADQDYATTFQMKMLRGSFLRKGLEGYVPGQIVINEKTARALGLSIDDAIGTQLTTLQGIKVTVSGIIKDYNFENLHEAIGPIAIVDVRDAIAYRFLVIKLNVNQNLSKTIANIQQKWKEVSPDAPFDYTFMDDTFASLYKTEIQLKKAFGVASFLNLLIIFLGLSGIVSYSLAKRKKEIAIRKVLGADVGKVLYLLIKEYSMILVLGNIIAWPIAYWFTSKWLHSFVYRIHSNWIYYLIVGVAISVLTCSLIIIESLRTVKRNPVKSLRSE